MFFCGSAGMLTVSPDKQPVSRLVKQKKAQAQHVGIEVVMGNQNTPRCANVPFLRWQKWNIFHPCAAVDVHTGLVDATEASCMYAVIHVHGSCQMKEASGLCWSHTGLKSLWLNHCHRSQVGVAYGFTITRTHTWLECAMCADCLDTLGWPASSQVHNTLPPTACNMHSTHLFTTPLFSIYIYIGLWHNP